MESLSLPSEKFYPKNLSVTKEEALHQRPSIIRINDIIKNLTSYCPSPDIELIEKAYVFSAKVHLGQVRLSGEPYLIHPLQVAYILTKMKLDETCVVTGLLHDTVENTYTTLQEIKNLFGPEITTLVDGLTKISKMNFQSTEERQAENFRKMILSMAKDIRVILIKLADRLHNMRTLEFLPLEKQKSISQETLEIYSPIANRLGIDWIKTELEDLSFTYLHPEEFHYLGERIKAQENELNHYIEEVRKLISDKLAHLNLREEIIGRLKHYYSIYKKMLRQQIDFDQVYDLIAFRVIVGSVKDCYEALGNIHAAWKPVPGRFKDFIAMPKANMYQSLHTTVIGPRGERMEIQIRTLEMHKIAEGGIAAHWRYKEGKAGDKRTDQVFSWLRQMLEWQQDLKDPSEFLETVRIDLFPDEVYVFTPKGEVKAFPQEATPIDLAYSVHSDVGHHCVGARANGRMVPLNYHLKNGDTIDIITSVHQKPSKDWLKIVKTSRARTKIRQWLRLEQRNDNIQAGRGMCEREFKRYNLNFTKLYKAGEISKLAEEFSFHDIPDFFAAIGYGKVSVSQLIQKFISPEKFEKQRSLIQEKQKEKRKKKSDTPSSGIQVRGLDHVLINFARCCNPIPGEKIMGYITKGRGVTIHVDGCPRLSEFDSERKIEVNWTVNQELTRPVKIKILSHDKPGLLAEISGAIAKLNCNIKGANVATTQDHRGISIFEVEVKDLSQIENIIRTVQKIKGVITVSRLKI